MKRLGITQRVELIKGYGERRDCLDQRWSKLALLLDYLPLPLPNIEPDQVADLVDNLGLDAILLSGGNSITSLNPAATDAAPERDAFESALIEKALSRSIPLLGICRGMQMLNIYLGGDLRPIEGHVATRHAITAIDDRHTLPEMVNSYHNWSIAPTDLAAGLIPIAFDQLGNIEAFESIQRDLLAIMWHPERELPFSSTDLKLIEGFLS